MLRLCVCSTLRRTGTSSPFLYKSDFPRVNERTPGEVSFGSVSEQLKGSTNPLDIIQAGTDFKSLGSTTSSYKMS